MDSFPAVSAGAVSCLACRAEAEADADASFCSGCGARLRPGWLCWGCSTLNFPAAAACSCCGRRAETPEAEKARRLETAAGLSFLALALVAVGWLFLMDVRDGKHVLSTKDGRFQRSVQSGQPDR